MSDQDNGQPAVAPAPSGDEIAVYYRPDLNPRDECVFGVPRENLTVGYMNAQPDWQQRSILHAGYYTLLPAPAQSSPVENQGATQYSSQPQA